MLIRMTDERLEELLRDAYLDGYEDGCAPDRRPSADELWNIAVTKDQFDALKERVHNGGQP